MAMAMPADPQTKPQALQKRERERLASQQVFLNKALLPDAVSHQPWPQEGWPILMEAPHIVIFQKETIKELIGVTYGKTIKKIKEIYITFKEYHRTSTTNKTNEYTRK